MCPTEPCTSWETRRERTRAKVVISCSTFSNADHGYGGDTFRIQPIRPRYIDGDWRRPTNYSERVICFRGTHTVPTAACDHCLTMIHEPQPSASFASGVRKLCPSLRNERLTPQQRIVSRIIRDISRCTYGPLVTKFYCPAPYFYLPRDVGTCLSLSKRYICSDFKRAVLIRFC